MGLMAYALAAMAVDLPLPFKPLEDEFLRVAMAAALGTQPLHPLVPDIMGVGVYALYYLPRTLPRDTLLNAYAAQCKGAKLPLYVGVAVKADYADADGSWAVRSRLKLHRKKLDAASGMTAADFRCRVLACDNRWAALVEHYLIQAYDPVWNSRLMRGFGSNVRGSGRAGQSASQWEVVHQGMSSPRWVRRDVASAAIGHLASTAGQRSYRFTDR